MSDFIAVIIINSNNCLIKINNKSRDLIGIPMRSGRRISCETAAQPTLTHRESYLNTITVMLYEIFHTLPCDSPFYVTAFRNLNKFVSIIDAIKYFNR